MSFNRTKEKSLKEKEPSHESPHVQIGKNYWYKNGVS